MRLLRLILLLALSLSIAQTNGMEANHDDSAAIISHIKRTPVQSTALATVGYSKSLHALEIEFRNGAIYRYLDVSRKIHLDLLSAPSKARFYDANIRGKYRSVHVRPRPK